MNIAVVIPAYNEEGMIGTVVEEVRKQSPHIFVVDDGSRDGTAQVASHAGAIVLRHVVNRGQGAALQTGIDAALAHGADIIVTFDADGQMRSEDIPAMVAPIIAGDCDVALGSRFLGVVAGEATAPHNLHAMPSLRRLTLKAGLIFTNFTTGLRLTDTHNGFRALSRRAAEKLHLTCDRMAHASEFLEQISKKRLRFREVPIVVRYTDYSRAKGQKLSGAFKILRDLVISSWMSR